MLKDWHDISRIPMRNFLFGNGLGRTYWDNFAYRSLLENFADRPVGRYLCTKDIFSKLKTENFEEVLRAVYHAYCVSIDNQDAIKTLYLDVQNALISAVNSVHPQPKDIPSGKIGECLMAYDAIFTTNYDLIPYWALLSGWSHSLVDYFWDGGVFNPRNVAVRAGRKPIHFLHGALHLRSTEEFNAKKIRITLESGVEGAFDSGLIDIFPLFITEGKSEFKLSRIRSNNYLNFCYERLCRSDGGLVIYGHDLNPEYDGHIVDAIRRSGNEQIVISIFSRLDKSTKSLTMARIRALFADLDKEIIFFESATHPIAQCGA